MGFWAIATFRSNKTQYNHQQHQQLQQQQQQQQQQHQQQNIQQHELTSSHRKCHRPQQQLQKQTIETYIRRVEDRSAQKDHQRHRTAQPQEQPKLYQQGQTLWKEKHKNERCQKQKQQQKQQHKQQQKQQQEELQEGREQFTQHDWQKGTYANGCTTSVSKTNTTTTTTTTRSITTITTAQHHHKWRTWWRSVLGVGVCGQPHAAKAKTFAATDRGSRFSWLWIGLLLSSALCMTAPVPAAAASASAAARSASAVTAAAVLATTTSAASVLVARATTFEPTFPFAIDEDDADNEADGNVEELEEAEVFTEPEELLDAPSNEQQLVAFYHRAQESHQPHRHRQRDASTLLAAAVDFDDIVPTADVVSTDAHADVQQTPAKRSAPAEATTTTTSAGPLLASTATRDSSNVSPSASINSEPSTAEEKCEPKVMDEVLPHPFDDYTDIIEDAARQFTEFLVSKFPATAPASSASTFASEPEFISDQLREEVRRRANGIASYALNEGGNLLAFALAAPSIHTVVVKFKDNVTIPPEQVHNRAFLGSYWRELGYAWNSSEGVQEWGAPFRDCNLLKGRWLWPFRGSFAEYKIKIVAAAFIAADKDVCNDGLEEVFGRRHGCDRNTTFCMLTENKPAAMRDVYTCFCREGFYLPNSTVQGFRGDIVEMSEDYDNYSCIPCPGGCGSCDMNGVCLFGEPLEAVSLENLLKVSVGSVLGACILCCVVLSVIVFRQRKSKAIASGMWTVLETILLGIVLLYASVAVHFFAASTERCLLEPWLRELGFITCYGAIILKLYRHLVDFRTRKAHRWVLRDVDLLKYLGTMVFAVICYMAAFTASSLDLLETAQLETLREALTNTCHPLKWDYVTQASELLILCFGLHLSFASRNANTQFRERQFLVASLVLEFLFSSTFYMLRFVYLPEMSPGAIFLALFMRSQLTNTVGLGLIFVPKLWYQHKQVRSLAHDLSIRLPVDAFKGSHDAGQRLGGGYAGLCLGDPDIGELTISEMSPEDIRAELKRLYTQLEILKNKTLRQDNPHISKRRGGRKAGHRRFSLQALSAKHRSNKHHQDLEITEAEPSRTPEDSVCSAEGPTDTYAEISGISHSMLSHSVVSHSK